MKVYRINYSAELPYLDGLFRGNWLVDSVETVERLKKEKRPEVTITSIELLELDTDGVFRIIDIL